MVNSTHKAREDDADMIKGVDEKGKWEGGLGRPNAAALFPFVHHHSKSMACQQNEKRLEKKGKIMYVGENSSSLFCRFLVCVRMWLGGALAHLMRTRNWRRN